MAAYNQNNQPQNPYATPLYNAPAYNNQPYNNQAYNNERSNESHVPLTDGFENDKPPTYVGEGLLDQKGSEKGYGGEDQKDDRFDHQRNFGNGYGEVHQDGVNPPGPKYFA